MPLLDKKSPLGEAYILDEAIHIDSEYDKQPGQSNTDFTIKPGRRVVDNVVALEVTEFLTERGMTGLFSSLNMLDFELMLTDTTTGEDSSIQFSVELPAMDRTSTKKEVQSAVDSKINQKLRDTFSDGDWITFLSASTLEENFAFLYDFNAPVFPGGANPNGATIGFAAGVTLNSIRTLFRSGPNKRQSAGPILGFEKEDYETTPGSFSGELVAPNALNLIPYTYLDIFIDEVPEFQPFYRFYPDSNTITKRQVLPGKTRLLDQPLRRLDNLTFRVRLPGGAVPSEQFPVYIHLRVFHLMEGMDVPGYLAERTLIR